MNFKLNDFKIWLILISLVYVSCRKYEIRAQDSILGEWDVVEITSRYKDTVPIEIIEEQGQLGSFNIEEDSVSFTFTRNDTLFTSSSTWSFSAERASRAFYDPGFISTLTIDNEFIFEVEFEDGTRHSEKNAQEITFTTPDNGNPLCIEMVLEKK